MGYFVSSGLNLDLESGLGVGVFSGAPQSRSGFHVAKFELTC